MRQLVYYVAATLDGFIAGPDGGDPSGQDFFPIAPDLVQYIVEHFPETLPGPAREAMGITGEGRAFDTVLEGRASYEVGLEAGIDDAYPHLRHLVFSTSLGEAPGPGIEVVPGDARERVRELKVEDGKDIWLVGGGTLAHSLLPEIDRLVIKLNPAVIGSGVPLFDGPFQPTTFAVTDTAALDSGVQVMTLDRRVA